MESTGRKFRELLRIIITRVLDDAFPHFECEVEATKGSIALLEVLDDAQGVQVVIEEEPVGSHGGVERFLSGMTERRMAEIMHQRQRLS